MVSFKGDWREGDERPLYPDTTVHTVLSVVHHQQHRVAREAILISQQDLRAVFQTQNDDNWQLT